MRIRATQRNRNLCETRSGLLRSSTATLGNGSLTSMLCFAAFTCALAIVAEHKASAQQKPADPRVTESQLNVTFIKPGVTTRAEVLNRLAWADTGVREDRLFVARWVSSSADAGATVDEEVPAAVRRTWRAHNLLVEFDRQGVVTGVREVADKHLVEALSDWIARNPSTPLDLSKPIAIPVSYRRESATLLLSRESFEFQSPRKGCRVSPSDLKRVSLTNRFRTPQSSTESEAIYFTEKTTAGSKVTLQTDVAHLFLLLKYLSQTRLPLVGT